MCILPTMTPDTGHSPWLPMLAPIPASSAVLAVQAEWQQAAERFRSH